jgi:hypothetical protein
METLYLIINTIALFGWILLISFPTKRWTFTVVISGGISAILALFYIYFIVSAMTGDSSTGGDFSSLAGVKLLFQNDIGVLAGWAHYLAFDLFIGAWMTSNAQRLGLTHWKIIPCLFLTFMFGPVGLLTYFIVRAAMTKKVFHEHF